MDALHPEQTKLASTRGVNWGKLGSGGRASLLSLLATNAGGRSGRRLVLGLILLLMGHNMSVSGSWPMVALWWGSVLIIIHTFLSLSSLPSWPPMPDWF